MPRTIAAGKVQHTINCREETWDNLTEFKEANNLDDYGAVLDFLADFFLKFKDSLAAAEERDANSNQTIKEAKEAVEQARVRQAALDRREHRLQVWEQMAADQAGIAYLPVVAAKKLLAAGLGAPDIQALHKIVQATGVPVEDLVRTMDDVGGAIELARQLRAEASDWAAKRDTLSQNYTAELEKATDHLAAIVAQVKAQQQMAEEAKAGIVNADQYIGTVREFAQRVEHSYRLLGIVLQGPITQQLSAEQVARVEHMSLRSLCFLAGSIITIAVGLIGDKTLDIRQSAENMVPIRIRLSEIPGWIAPGDYRPQVELIRNQLQMMAQYQPEDEEDEDEEDDNEE